MIFIWPVQQQQLDDGLGVRKKCTARFGWLVLRGKHNLTFAKELEAGPTWAPKGPKCKLTLEQREKGVRYCLQSSLHVHFEHHPPKVKLDPHIHGKVTLDPSNRDQIRQPPTACWTQEMQKEGRGGGGLPSTACVVPRQTFHVRSLNPFMRGGRGTQLYVYLGMF